MHLYALKYKNTREKIMKKEKPTTKLCKHCKTEIPYDAKVCPQCHKKQGKNKIVTAAIVLMVLGAIGSATGNSKPASDTSTTTEASDHSFLLDYELQTADVKNGTGDTVIGKYAYISIPSEKLDEITGEDLKAFSDANVADASYNCVSIITDSGEGICFTGSIPYIATRGTLDTDGSLLETHGTWLLSGDEYSYEEASAEETDATEETDAVVADPSVPTEYVSALNKAMTYSSLMHMSKVGIYNQLTSEYGEKFSAEAAQYAVDNMTADWNANALAKAQEYSDMNMSKAGIYDQLISEYGENFTAEEAQYAVDNMTADWNANALAKAKTYQETMNMSPEAIRDQLTSEYGEKFTAEEADYAVSNLQ